MNNIENSHEIFLINVMQNVVKLHRIQMAYIKAIHDRISFLAISIT